MRMLLDCYYCSMKMCYFSFYKLATTNQLGHNNMVCRGRPYKQIREIHNNQIPEQVATFNSLNFIDIGVASYKGREGLPFNGVIYM